MRVLNFAPWLGVALYLIASKGLAEADRPVLLSNSCIESMAALPDALKKEDVESLCAQVAVEPNCTSAVGRPIFHLDKPSERPNPKKILAIGLIHGDEGPSGTLVAWWMKRLQEISPTSSWRLIPVSNPDGFKKQSRLNENGVDLNRNFPTSDWDDLALKYWKNKTQANPRRFPGLQASSEPETKCIIDHIEKFAPDFIISVHTPYAVLDFDGPKIEMPKFLQLPWQSLGNFPGSLGRMMWVDRQVPVMTVELKGQLPHNNEYLLDLQDVLGRVARMTKPSPKKLEAQKPHAEKVSFNTNEH